jgi:hypothetical protein
MPEPKPVYAIPPAASSGVNGHRLGPYLATLNCKACHSILVSVTEWEGKTAVILFTREKHPVLAFQARFRCLCGEERLFISVPMSAVRLGIADGERGSARKGGVWTDHAGWLSLKGIAPTDGQHITQEVANGRQETNDEGS